MYLRQRVEPLTLTVLMVRLNERKRDYGDRLGFILINPREFNLYANIFGNMEKNTSVSIHAGRKSLTFKGIELRAI